MKIIMIEGSSGVGKTTVLAVDFINWLTAQKAKIIVPIKKIYTKDREGVFYLHKKKKSIALCSEGDVYRHIVHAIVRYSHCDILVIAGNTDRPEIKRLVKAIRANRNNCVIKKTIATNTDAKKVLNKIIAAI